VLLLGQVRRTLLLDPLLGVMAVVVLELNPPMELQGARQEEMMWLMNNIIRMGQQGLLLLWDSHSLLPQHQQQVEVEG
jgi:hypothetical protein